MSEGSTLRSASAARRRWPWIAATGLFLFGVLGSFAVLNGTLYTAGNFVARYFEAIADDDVAAVLATPGVRPEADEAVSTALLRPGVIAEGPQQIRVRSDVVDAAGVHLVRIDYRLGGEPATASYRVRPLPALFGLIAQWEFVDSPLAPLQVTVNHGAEFRVGSLSLDTRAKKTAEELAGFSFSADYLAIAPARFELSFHSELLSAEPVAVNVQPNAPAQAALTLLPTRELVDRVQRELDRFLAECATQRVLQPSGCPFGAEVTDRVTSEPRWKLLSSPTVSLEPGPDAFIMPPAAGLAHLVVEVQNLRDGTAETIDRDEEFEVGLRVRLLDDESISIQLE